MKDEKEEGHEEEEEEEGDFNGGARLGRSFIVRRPQRHAMADPRFFVIPRLFFGNLFSVGRIVCDHRLVCRRVIGVDGIVRLFDRTRDRVPALDLSTRFFCALRVIVLRRQ